MEILLDNYENTLVIKIKGMIDTNTSTKFEDVVINSVKDNVVNIDFDFSKVDYISSAGIRVLLRAIKLITLKKGRITIINPNEIVLNVLDMTGISSLLVIKK